MTVRAVQVGALPAPPGDPAVVYAVQETGHIELWVWSASAGEFQHRANIDAGETRAWIIRQEAWTPPLAAVVEKDGWEPIGCDSGFIYLRVEVSL